MLAELWKKKKTLAGLAALLVAAAGLLLTSFADVRARSAAVPVVPHFYLLLIAALLAALAICGVVFFVLSKRPRIEHCAAALFVFLGILYMLTVLPFSSPDERSHYMTAYVLSDYLMGQEPFDENGKVMIREEDRLMQDGQERLSEAVGKADYAAFYGELFSGADSERMVPSDYADRAYTNSMLSRLPQALGITLGRLFHASFAMTLLLGRLLNLLFFAGFFWLALRLLPRGKMVFAAVGLFPMTISLAASFSYDSLLLSLNFLFIAYLFHLRDQKGPITAGQAVLTVLLLVAFTPWKINYALMALLCLILPREKFRGKKAYYACAAAAVLAVLIAVLVVNGGSLLNILVGTDTKLDYAQQDSYTLSYLLTHPVQSLKLCINTVRLQAEWYYQTMIGQYLGQLDLGLEIYSGIVAGFSIVALCSAVSVEGQPALYGRRDRRIAAVLVVLMSAVTILSMAVGWTPNTSPFIVGVQGRYFLCVLPLALLLLQGRLLSWKRPVCYGLLYAELVLHVLTLMRLMERISYR